MTWTTDPPDRAGFYLWVWKPHPPFLPSLLEVVAGGCGDVSWFVVTESGRLLVSKAGGWWWGPVPPPLVPPGDGGAVVSDSDRGPATADGQPWKGV